MESIIKDSNEVSKTNNIYWPYLIELKTFNKIINDKNNYIRLGLTSSNKINIECYNDEDLNNTYHKSSFNITEIQNLNDCFKSQKDIKEIYNNIIEILNKGEFDIKFSNTSISLILISNQKEVNINLNKEKISFLN